MAHEPSVSASATPFFTGTYSRVLDAKNRVAIPAAWVGDEGQKFFVTPNVPEKFLTVRPYAELQEAWRKITQSGLPPAKQKAMERFVFGGAKEVTADKQGRILLPPDYCQLIGLSGEVSLVGTMSRFEIWPKDRFDAKQAETSEDIWKLASELGL